MKLDQAIRVAKALGPGPKRRRYDGMRYCKGRIKNLLPLCTMAQAREASRIEHRTHYETAVTVPIDYILTDQEVLLPESLLFHLKDHAKRGRPIKRPVVVRLRTGKLILWDGNHRTVSRMLLGCRTMRVRLMTHKRMKKFAIRG